jgi:single-strand DNA-binding protein
MATNRTWVTENGEKKEETEFHRIVAWNKLAELCSQLLFKGRRVYVEGRLQTRQWTGQDGAARQATEIVIEDMLVLDSKRQGEEPVYEEAPMEPAVAAPVVPAAEEPASAPAPVKAASKSSKKKDNPEEVAGDIPF